MPYVVRFTPKHKSSGYKSFTLKPHKKTVKWNKTRAKRERQFARNHSSQGGGSLLKYSHYARIAKVK